MQFPDSVKMTTYRFGFTTWQGGNVGIDYVPALCAGTGVTSSHTTAGCTVTKLNGRSSMAGKTAAHVWCTPQHTFMPTQHQTIIRLDPACKPVATANSMQPLPLLCRHGT